MPLINETAPFEIYATSTNTSSTDDACEPLPEDTPDLTGKVVIIHRGTCAFVEKFEHAAKFGASLFLVYKWVSAVYLLRVMWLTTPPVFSDDRPFNSISTGDYTAALIPRDSGVFVSSVAPAAWLPVTHEIYSWSKTSLKGTRSRSLSRIARQV